MWISRGILCRLQADTDGYLIEVYGDWRTIPPVGKRKIHAVYMNTKLDKKQ